MENIAEILTDIKNRQLEIEDLSQYLTKLESQLSLVFAANPDMIVFVNTSGEIQKVSMAAKRILGYGVESMIGKNILDFVHPDDVEKTKYALGDVLNVKFLYFEDHNYFVNRWRNAKGNYVKLAWRFTVYDKNHETIIGFATSVEDMVNMNPFSFNIFQKAIANCAEGIVITDYHDHNNPIIYANPSFCDITGYTFEELVGNNCRFLQSNDGDQQALHTIRDAVRVGKACQVLLKNFRKDRTIFYNYINIYPIIENGEVKNYLGITQDYTDFIDKGYYKWDRKSSNGFGS